jgi:hypothetical protein
VEIEPRPPGPLTDADREAAAELTGFDLMGDRELRLAPVARVPGTPLIHVKAYTVMGDVRIRSSGAEEPAKRGWHRGK